MKLILIIFLIYTLHVIDSKVPNGYVDPSNLKNYDRGRYSSFRQRDVDENLSQKQLSVCECDYKDCKHYEDDVLILHNYHKRLVNSLLNTLKVSGDDYKLKLNTKITEEQFQILKNYGLSKELNADMLRQVDDLISDILYEAQSTSVYDSINENWIHCLKVFLTTQNIIIIAVVAVVYMTYRLIHIKFSIMRAASLFIFVFLIIGFGWTWHDLVEEEEIKLMAQRMQYPIPPECNAAEMTWWQRLTSKTPVDCEKFVRAHNKKAALSITPQKVFSEMLGQSMSHILYHFIGSLVEFITKMHGSLPFPFNYLSLPFLLMFVLLLIVLLVIILSGVRLKLGILNIFNVEIGSSSNRIPYSRNNITNEHREYLQQIPQRARLEPINVNNGGEIQIQNRRLLLEDNADNRQVQREIQQPTHLEQVNVKEGDEMQNQDSSLEENVNELQLPTSRIQELECPVESYDNKNTISKNNKLETSGSILTKTQNDSCQTKSIDTTKQSQQTSDYCENYKKDNTRTENIDHKPTSYMDDDKSHGDDILTNAIHDIKEETCNKLEIGNGDMA